VAAIDQAQGLRRATVADAPRIAALIQPFAAQDLMLPRPLPALYEQIRDFLVVDDGDRLAACVALHVFDAELAEIKSLAVADEAAGRGLGSALIERAMADAAELWGWPRSLPWSCGWDCSNGWASGWWRRKTCPKRSGASASTARSFTAATRSRWSGTSRRGAARNTVARLGRKRVVPADVP